MHKPNLGKLDFIDVINPVGFDWIYYFLGESDHVSHVYTQHSKEGKDFLLKLDGFIEKRYKEFEKEHPDFTFIFWSDHGHIPITKRYNLYDEFRKYKVNLKKIFHIIDSTTVRFWPEDNFQRIKIRKIMKEIPEANLVSKEEYSELHLPKDKNLYGELFYYLGGGITFTHTIHGFGLKTKSMHGYHPKAEGNLGLFISNKKIIGDKATLPDVFVTSINNLGIDYKLKAGLDGLNILS
jgi:predicted AlkP superfamily pyrophosphatase or phosphodiesterase